MGHASKLITVDVYGDKNRIIADCLACLESFIESVVPKDDDRIIRNYSNVRMDIIFDNYYTNLMLS